MFIYCARKSLALLEAGLAFNNAYYYLFAKWFQHVPDAFALEHFRSFAIYFTPTLGEGRLDWAAYACRKRRHSHAETHTLTRAAEKSIQTNASR
jgi:hypothetical protein